MGAVDLLEHLSDIGLTVNLAGDELQVGPKAALTDDARALIRAHKGELIAALKPEPIPESLSPEIESSVLNPVNFDTDTRSRTREAMSGKVLAMLDRSPGIKYGLITDTESDPEDVILTLGIRDIGAAELRIPKSKYDAFAIMKAVETLQ